MNDRDLVQAIEGFVHDESTVERHMLSILFLKLVHTERHIMSTLSDMEAKLQAVTEALAANFAQQATTLADIQAKLNDAITASGADLSHFDDVIASINANTESLKSMDPGSATPNPSAPPTGSTTSTGAGDAGSTSVAPTAGTGTSGATATGTGALGGDAGATPPVGSTPGTTATGGDATGSAPL